MFNMTFRCHIKWCMIGLYIIQLCLGGEGKMNFDFKKEYKDLYMPKTKPVIVEIPKMNYIAVKGKGNTHVL